MRACRVVSRHLPSFLKQHVENSSCRVATFASEARTFDIDICLLPMQYLGTGQATTQDGVLLAAIINRDVLGVERPCRCRHTTYEAHPPPATRHHARSFLGLGPVERRAPHGARAVVVLMRLCRTTKAGRSGSLSARTTFRRNCVPCVTSHMLDKFYTKYDDSLVLTSSSRSSWQSCSSWQLCPSSASPPPPPPRAPPSPSSSSPSFA